MRVPSVRLQSKTESEPGGGVAEAMLLSVEHLTTRFRTRSGWLTAVNDVSFTLRQGSVLGVLGETGSGKSATLRTILGLQAKSARVSGKVILDGQDLMSMSARQRAAMRGSSVSMVFQDPMTALDPVFTIESQLVETIQRHSDMTRREAKARALELLALVQIPAAEYRLKAYPHELSGGMRQRVVIAMALVSSPKLLLADEPTTALDVTVQATVLSLLRDLRNRLGVAIIFVTHDLGVAAEISDQIAVMYAGQLVEHGTKSEIVRSARHPYTQGLLGANVQPGRVGRLEVIRGSPPNLEHLPPGCPFAPRCSLVEDRCWASAIELIRLSPSHAARCVWLEGRGETK